MEDKKKKEHLSIYGVGPYYGFIVVVLTVLAVIFRNHSSISKGKIEFIRIPCIAIGVVLIVVAIYMWIQAVLIDKIDDGIMQNQLVTHGIYGFVRNPIYSCIMIFCTGIVIITGNVFLFFLPIVFWLCMTVLVSQTEEKWLRALYGEAFEEYCRTVNRCIPFPPRRYKEKK